MTIYAVNGKEPIAAWIPSLDTAGNGTTTLTDLVGSNDGTLTNMDAATDWVADTDAGGVRALDFDGGNDYVETLPSETIISLWVKGAAQSDRRIFAYGRSTNNQPVYALGSGSINQSKMRVLIRADVSGTLLSAESTSTILDNQWHHIIWHDISGSVSLYVDGVIDATNFNYTPGTTTLDRGCIGALLRITSGFYFSGRIDDIRIFDQALDATDIAYLYNSGNGRGIVATTPNTRRRRYAGGYGL